MSKIEIALAGNPNSGKTSTFNELTGSNQYVGNWPGVTVERKEGCLKQQKDILIQDLPGIYSLSPYTPEEVVARDYLLDGHPQAILNVVDGTNLTRNLYLTTQLLEVGVPVVVAVNMMDLVKKSGMELNLDKLAYGLGVEVVGMSAAKKKGLQEALDRTLKQIKSTQPLTMPHYDERLEAALSEIQTVIQGKVPEAQQRWHGIKLFERDALTQEKLTLSKAELSEIEEIIQITEKLFRDDSETIIINERYRFIDTLMRLCALDCREVKLSDSDKIDRIVTNRWLALPIFAFIMWLVYFLAIQTIGGIGTDWVNDVLFGEVIPDKLATLLQQWQVASWMQELILDGILAGVGAILGFLPQMIVLFLCLAFLEDCGYMSRIAFVMDRIFRKFGLSGKSFIPMMIATGCGVPGVMASRTIENEKDRRMTIMVTTFMPCSAKLPIIALVAGAFFPNSSWVAPSAYFVGCGAIVLSGIALKKTKLFAGDPAPFIMELPAYHLPNPRNIFRQTYDRSKAFVVKAGTIIFVSSIILWFLQAYSFNLQRVSADQSILAGLGRVIAPLFIPLGWGHWQGAVATVTGLVAKENVISTLGILLGKQEVVTESGTEIWGALQGIFTSVSAYSFLLFNLLCAPCFAAIGAIHREMSSRKWTWIAIGYQCGLAYVVSFIFYQFAHLLFETGTITFATILAGGAVATIVYFILRKPQSQSQKAMKVVGNL